MNRHSYDRARALLRSEVGQIAESRYSASSFGSWYITVSGEPSLRLVWDGKEAWLVVQRGTSAGIWNDLWILRKPVDEEATLRSSIAAIKRAKRGTV